MAIEKNKNWEMANGNYPGWAVYAACKANLWKRVKGLLIADAKKQNMSILEYIKYLKAYYEIHKERH